MRRAWERIVAIVLCGLLLAALPLQQALASCRDALAIAARGAER